MADRKKNLIVINSLTGILNRIVVILFGMIFRRIFILYLGESISGLSSLYTSILNFLSIATAGLGSAAIYRIYLYNANNETDKILEIEKFTRLFYRIVTCFIFVVGIIFSIFLNRMIMNNEYSILFLRSVFMIQVLSECISYWFSSKRMILQALEKLYLISVVEIVTNICVYILQIFIIITTQNYYLYLFTLVLKYAIIGILIHLLSIKEFPWIKKKSNFKLSEVKYLFHDLKNTIFVQISNFIFLSTDSLVISNFLGLVFVNLYDNYMIIINALLSAVDEINAALRAAFGNILAKDSEKQKKLQFITSTTFIQFLISTFCIVSIKCLIDDFIVIWLGDKYIMSSKVSNIIILNLYCILLSSPFKNYMTMCGKFNIDKKIILSSAILNIILSIILVKRIGLAGVILGTLIGNIFMWVERGVYFFKEFEGQEVLLYFSELIKYMLVTIISMFFTITITDYIGIWIINAYLSFVIKIIVCIIFSVGIPLFLFRKRSEVKKLIKLCKGAISHGK